MTETDMWWVGDRHEQESQYTSFCCGMPRCRDTSDLFYAGAGAGSDSGACHHRRRSRLPPAMNMRSGRLRRESRGMEEPQISARPAQDDVRHQQERLSSHNGGRIQYRTIHIPIVPGSACFPAFFCITYAPDKYI